MILPAKEEAVLSEAILAARKVQEFLWGKADEGFGWEEWKRMFRKRVAKLDDVDANAPYAVIEIRKRLLQQAALSIAMLAYLDHTDKLPVPEAPAQSALPEYDEPFDSMDKAATSVPAPELKPDMPEITEEIKTEGHWTWYLQRVNNMSKYKFVHLGEPLIYPCKVHSKYYGVVSGQHAYGHTFQYQVPRVCTECGWRHTGWGITGEIPSEPPTVKPVQAEAVPEGWSKINDAEDFKWYCLAIDLRAKHSYTHVNKPEAFPCLVFSLPAGSGEYSHTFRYQELVSCKSCGHHAPAWGQIAVPVAGAKQ